MISLIQEYVKRRIFVWSNALDSGTTKAELAALRRGLGKKPGEIPSLWGSFLLDLPEPLMSKSDEPSPAEWAIYVSLTTYALHQQGHAESVNRNGYQYSLGHAVGKLVENEDAMERVKRRFSCMASSDEMVELSYHIRTIIQLLRAGNIELDYSDLAKDLYLFQCGDSANNVRLKWGRDFYRQIDNKEKGKDN